MQASDIMSTPVVSVAPDTPVKEIAALLFEKRISGVPVLDQGRLVGLISEGDLLHRHEMGTDRASRPGPWWLRMFSGDQTPAEYIKAHGRFARDIMTREVTTIMPETPVAEIATLLESRAIKRVPVMRDEQLIGIVSRANLVQALAGMRPAAVRVTPPADQAIRGRLQAELERQSWWREAASNVIVTDGVVHYFGTVHSDDQQDAARVAAENIPGVRGVEDHRVRFRQVAGWE
ncbi:MAG TPA: CBS domain-containing protein [Burkholderiales bacterium]|nr:CBS domain-containing protein [Burkholderiales bacterium]